MRPLDIIYDEDGVYLLYLADGLLCCSCADANGSENNCGHKLILGHGKIGGELRHGSTFDEYKSVLAEAGPVEGNRWLLRHLEMRRCVGGAR